MSRKFRIICHDDPFEETIYYDSRGALLGSIQTWFGEDGYRSIAEFNKERRGIHSAQIKKKGRWVNIPWKKQTNRRH